MESEQKHVWHSLAQCRLNPGLRPEGGCYHGKMYSSSRRQRAEADAATVAIAMASYAGQSVEFRHRKTPLFHRFPCFTTDDVAMDITPR